MWLRIIAIAVFGTATIGCDRIEQVRMRPYEVKELRCLRDYRTGDIQTARAALLDYLAVLDAEKASGLPFRRTAWGKAMAMARLTLICRQLGETNAASGFLERAIAYAKQDAREEKDLDLLARTDQAIGSNLVELVVLLDENNTHPKWREH